MFLARCRNGDVSKSTTTRNQSSYPSPSPSIRRSRCVIALPAAVLYAVKLFSFKNGRADE
ncbi:hypothetical protein CDEST_04900 [Colletotrichum destructivum]|uniref:Uncharacterized protein n=1 Tax=Colletotrichum destructivum TaxID=34406 RepID=A0AAX4IA14_9PEZI|nr:hypothetical protein CDEST_04900 [Colletotrichum destructivum]